jgi:hypothetical protein
VRNPKVIARYNRIQKKEKQRHNVGEKIFYVLDQATKGLFDAETATIYENAAQQDTRARRHAQANFRPIYMGQVPFFDVTSLAHDEIHLWKSMVRKRQGISISPKLLRRLPKKFNRRDAYNMSMAEVVAAEHDALKRYRQQKKTGWGLTSEISSYSS